MRFLGKLLSLHLVSERPGLTSTTSCATTNILTRSRPSIRIVFGKSSRPSFRTPLNEECRSMELRRDGLNCNRSGIGATTRP